MSEEIKRWRRFLGRILRILPTEYRISPLQKGRQYWNRNQAVIFTGNECGKESNPNVNSEAERASSFSLCRVGHWMKVELLRNSSFPGKSPFPSTECTWYSLRIPNRFSPLPPPKVSSSINSRKIILYLKILRCIVPGPAQRRGHRELSTCREASSLPCHFWALQLQVPALPVKETKSSLAL